MKIKTYLKTRLAFGLIVWIVLGYGVAAMAFEGGTGEPNDPYRIATAEQLISIGSDPNLLSRHFVLVADIDLDPWLPGGRVFEQALISSTFYSSFDGSFDGAGHLIKNLFVASNNDYAGLFGRVGEGGTLKNLGIENVSVTGRQWIGGLVGYNSGTVTLCYSTGSVMGVRMGAGGLVGLNEGQVSSCHSTCTVTVADLCVGGLVGSNKGSVSSCHSSGRVAGPKWVGGLVGWNSGTVTLCYSTGEVADADSEVGGLVGLNTGRVSACYSTASVTGLSDSVGGLVGVNEGTVTSCHASGGVVGSEEVGGLVGWNLGAVSACYSTASVTGLYFEVGRLVGDNGGTISSCYSTGRVSGWVAPQGPEWVGGLVGWNGKQGRIVSSYFLAPSDGGGPDNGLGTALTAGQMRQQDRFIDFDFWGNKADGLGDEWWMPADSPPVLAWQTEVTGLLAIPDLRGLTEEEARRVLEALGLILAPVVQTDYDRTIRTGCVLGIYYPRSYVAPGGTVEVVVSKGSYDWSTNPGDGRSHRPFQIRTASQLDSLVGHPEMGWAYFVQTADIDMAGRTYSKALIAPDVNDSTEGFQGTVFTGNFNGSGFKILNLDIFSPNKDYLGLFGYIAKGAIVRDVHLVNARVKGIYYIGTVAGYNAGTITSCSATGEVSGDSDSTGHLVGVNEGVIENCDGEGVK